MDPFLSNRRCPGNNFAPHSLGGGGIVLVSDPENEVDMTTYN